MAPILAFIALLGFLLSLAVHIAALAGIDVEDKLPAVWMAAMVFGVVVVFSAFMLSSRKVFGGRLNFDELRAALPRPVATFAKVLFVYVIVNFALFIHATQGGNPAIQHGQFVLLEHGQLIRTLTAGEYAALRANEARGFSGHLMLFYFVPFAYFAYARPSRLRAMR